MEHARSFYHNRNQIAVPLVLASPEERIMTSYKSSDDRDRFVSSGGCATTLSSNTLVFAVQIITAALCHVLLPLVQTICTVAPKEHAPSFYHYPNKFAVLLVLASPEERISTSYYFMLQ
ncbi:hypothetical protein MRX96_023884 [Rhipicephalus microplus]